MLRVRPFVNMLVAVGLMVNPIAAIQVHAQGLSKADYEACQSRDEGAFRNSIETITREALARALANFDAQAAVAEAWRTAGADDAIDKRVDSAVTEIASETSWSDKLKSLAYSDKAQGLAKAVAERVYRAEPVKRAIETVTVDVNRALGSSLEIASADAASPTVACLKAFLGTRYGATVSGEVTTRAENDYGLDGKGRAPVSNATIVQQSGEGIAGAAILLVRRQLANMASRVGARIVGSVLSRLVTVAAGGVGAVLIARDLWQLSGGVLPIVATEMKAKATKDLVQAELTKSITDAVTEQIKDISSKSADHILSIWQDFKRAHAKSLELADTNAGFRTFLDVTAAANLPRLDEVVGLLLAAEGEAGILKRLADGTLDAAVNQLAPGGMDIARETRSIDTGLKWSALAGNLLPQVVANELYRRANADDFTRGSLEKLLALDDRLAIARLAELKRDARDTLFDLSESDLKKLASALSTADLAALASYFTGLERPVRDRLLQAIARAPTKMRLLASRRVRDAVMASRNQSIAVDMMLRANASTPAEIIADGRSAVDGDVSPILMWERHPIAVSALIIPLLAILALLSRIFSPRRRPGAPTPAR